jgi:hypothetical protein
MKRLLKFKGRHKPSIYWSTKKIVLISDLLYYLIEVRVNGHRQRYKLGTWSDNHELTTIYVDEKKRQIILCGEGHRTNQKASGLDYLILDEKLNLYYSNRGTQYIYENRIDDWSHVKASNANWILLGCNDKFRVIKIWRQKR